jgi:type VI secretion system protein ImpM
MTPGWFGKLPGMGDFASRRLPNDFRETCDRWLQRGLTRLRARHDDWTEHYLQAPLWCFALGTGVAGERAWIGVLMPSVDAVGRYFPLIVAAAWNAPAAGGEALARHWWVRCAQAALEALEQDMDALRFDALLQRLFAADAVGFADEEDGDGSGDECGDECGEADDGNADEDGTDGTKEGMEGMEMPDVPEIPTMPGEGESLWSAGTARIVARGLPEGVLFDQLLGAPSGDGPLP